MFGFLIGTACLIGLIATVRRHRHAYGCGYGYGYGPRSYGGCGGRRGEGRHDDDHRHHDEGPPWARRRWSRGPRGILSMISRRLDLTPGQEKAFREAFDELRSAMRKGRGELKDSRRDVARAFRAASFDAVLLGELFARHDSTLEEIRKAVVGALAKVHDALDERQREEVAKILEEGWW
jgi:uncharacterized membrane protein